MGTGADYTDYVSTRWYRSPELLVGDTQYDETVDIWATGCIFSELLTGSALFPGETDLDQLYKITKVLGPITSRQSDILSKNPLYNGFKFPEISKFTTLEGKLHQISLDALEIIKVKIYVYT